jgi:hypothetical protein
MIEILRIGMKLPEIGAYARCQPKKQQSKEKENNWIIEQELPVLYQTRNHKDEDQKQENWFAARPK